MSETKSFGRSAAQLRLLRFLLENAGTEDAPLKETYIGAVFYGRAANYDPREDSIVRVSVNRLRNKLTEHYANEGAEESTRFVLPRGGYHVLVVNVPPIPKAEVDEPGFIPKVLLLDQTSTQLTSRNSLGRWRPGYVRPAIITVAIFLIVVAVLGGSRVVQQARRPWFMKASLEAAPVTPGTESEFDPAISPDSKSLAYISRKAGTVHYQIFIRPMAPTSEPARGLETGSGDVLHPAWSPDGKNLAFLHCGIQSCAFQTVPVAGGTVKTLRELPRFSLVTDQLAFEYRQLWPMWTPDGRALVFPYRGLDDDAERLIIHDLASGQETKLTGGDLWDEDDASTLSPDGRTVAFRRAKLSYSELWTVDLFTHQQKRIVTPFGLYWSGLTWARDGSGLLTTMKDPNNVWKLWWLPLHGAPQMLPVAQNMPLTPVLAPDNKSLLVVSADRSSSLTLLDTSPDRAVPLLNQAADEGDLWVEFSPDEKHAAMLSESTGQREVWLADLIEKKLVNRRQLTHGLGQTSMSLAWSPDSALIAVGSPQVRGLLKVVDAESGSVETLHVPGLEKSLIIGPIFSPDGKFLFASASSDVGSGVYRISIGPVPRADFVISGHPYDIAFDGTNTLYLDVRNANGIEKVDLREWDMKSPLARTASKLVPQLRDVLALKSWTLRKGSIYYLDLHDDERRLRRLNLATGETSSVTGTLPRISFYNGALAYAPARHLLIYSQLKNKSGAQIISLQK